MYFFSNTDSEELKRLLDDPDPSLEDILDQEALVQEIQASNPKLIRFLVKQNIFDAIVSYVIDLPGNLDIDPLQPHRDLKMNKFPLVATRILTAKNEIIANIFLGIIRTEKLMDIESETIPDDDINENSQQISGINDEETATDMFAEIPCPLTKFLKFLDQEAPLNPTLSGYFTQIMLHYLKSKDEIFILILLKEYFNSLEKMAKHVYNDSIEEFLEDFFKFEIRLSEDTILSDNFSELMTKLLTILLQNIIETPQYDYDPSIGLDLKENTAKLFNSILTKPNHLIRDNIGNLFKEEHIQKLYTSLLSLENVGPVSSILKDLSTFYETSPPVVDSPLSHLTESKSQHDLWSEFYFEKVSTEYIDHIVKILDIENKELNPQPLVLQYGLSSYQFGLARMKLVEVLRMLIMHKNQDLNQKIADSRCFEVLLSLIIRNPWNNLLHETIYKILKFSVCCDSDVYILSLFKGAKFLDFIIEAAANSEIEIVSKQKTKVQKGYLAYLVLIANYIAVIECPLIKTFTSQHEGWKNFKEGFLAAHNQKNEHSIFEKEFSKPPTPLREFPRTQLPKPNYAEDDDESNKNDDYEESFPEQQFNIEKQNGFEN